MAKGRNVVPFQAKVLSGTARADRKKNEAAVKHGLPPCPTYLNLAAKKYWADIGQQLADAGLLALVDSAAFGAHCDSVGKYDMVSRKLKKLDDLIDKTPNNLVIQSALWTIRNKLWDQVIKSSDLFGLQPASRSRINLPASGQESLPFGDESGWGDPNLDRK